MQLKRLFYTGTLICIFFLFEPKTTFAQEIVKIEDRFFNGKIKLKGKEVNGKKEGVWLYYYPDGGVSVKEKWNTGTFVWRIEFNEKHKKTLGINAKGDTIRYKSCNCLN
jgi:antitoxin component YwqK of YwqJK toxin-antitoxin module